jgi:hypothetical protein
LKGDIAGAVARSGRAARNACVVVLSAGWRHSEQYSSEQTEDSGTKARCRIALQKTSGGGLELGYCKAV